MSGIGAVLVEDTVVIIVFLEADVRVGVDLVYFQYPVLGRHATNIIADFAAAKGVTEINAVGEAGNQSRRGYRP